MEEEKIYKQKVILVIVCFIILIYISLKGLFLYWFSPYNKVRVPEYITITIKHKDAEQYMTVSNFSIRNDIGDYTLITNDPSRQDEIEVDHHSNTDSTVYERDGGLMIRHADVSTDFDDIYASNVIEYEYLRLFGIHNNYDMHKFISKYKSYENHFYTPIYLLLRNKYIQEELDKYWSKGGTNNIYLIDGDYKGYYYELHNGQFRVFTLYKRGKIYQMSFSGSKYTREQVFDLLSTVIIK